MGPGAGRVRGWRGGCWGIPKLECSHDASAVGGLRARVRGWLAVCRLVFAVGKPRGREGFESSELDFAIEIELKSLILAQIERWRHALHMQVERQRGTRATEPWRRAANG